MRRVMRSTRLDPGSALRAVRDDAERKKGAAVRDDVAFCCHPRECGDPVRLAARPLDPGSALRAVRDDVRKSVRRPG